MGITKRQMLLVPEVNDTSFVFFYERGNSGISWSVRDYSISNRVKVQRPTNLPGTTADHFFEKARYAFNAPTHDTNDLEFWHKYTTELNQKYGLRTTVQSAGALTGSDMGSVKSYPVLALEKLLRLPKGRKTQDMERILHSSNSEDWVTWNVFQVLFRDHPNTWWQQVMAVAKGRNPDLALSEDVLHLPTVSFWDLVEPPEIYLEDSRRRMLCSRNSIWVARAVADKAVEGDSEIDVTVESGESLIFIESKLGSDISLNTTYDPSRNQIARNIDCLIERAGDREIAFWMLVRDEEPSRAYVQFMAAYKADPSLLGRDLPHRAPDQLEQVCRNLTTLRWSDFQTLVSWRDADTEIEAVKHELQRRIRNL